MTCYACDMTRPWDLFCYIWSDSSQNHDDFIDVWKGLRVEKGTKCFGHFRKVRGDIKKVAKRYNQSQNTPQIVQRDAHFDLATMGGKLVEIRDKPHFPDT